MENENIYIVDLFLLKAEADVLMTKRCDEKNDEKC
jgi:hypothetical protein